MMCCTKHNTCLNYKIRCADCKANSDIYNHYPLYKDRDLVEVVRCKECRMFVDNKSALTTHCTRECKNLTVKPDDFCSYGERREENEGQAD